MITIIKERKAIYRVARIAIEFNWIFREQPTIDFGIDAILETTISDRPSGKLFAAQIKGGTKKVRRTKLGFTIYMSDAHYTYWLSLAERIPVFMFFHDQLNDQVYWQLLDIENITKTAKHWKIYIPNQNKLNEQSRTQIEDIVINYHPFMELDMSDFDVGQMLNNEIDSNIVEISFSVKRNNKTTLFCKISDKRGFEEIELVYHHGLVLWDNKKKKLLWEDTYYFTISDLEKHITEKYNGLVIDDNPNPIRIMIDEINIWSLKDGIEGIARKLFNKENSEHGIPEYDKFIEAFEYYSKLNRGQYFAQTVGSEIHFKTLERNDFVIDTYEGKTRNLRYYIDQKSYDEIYTMTNESFWSEIYLDAGIEKEVFIPQMLSEWETYWDTLYDRIKLSVGSTEHLNDSKEKSWRQMQAFMDGYNDAGDIIKLALNFDDMTLYPIAVVTMMNIFNVDVCYSEYCEYEFFGSDEWDSICVRDDLPEYPMFFIKPGEF